MGSTLISEVVNNLHPWSNMIEARSYHSEHSAYEPSVSYRPALTSSSSSSSTTSSNSRRRTSSQGASLKAPSAANRHQVAQPISTPNSTSGISRSSKPRDAPVQTTIASNQPPSSSQNDQLPLPPKGPLPAPSAQTDPHMSPDSSTAVLDAVPAHDSNSVVSSSPQAQEYPGDSPPRVKVRDLQHIQNFALDTANSNSSSAAGSEKSYTSSPQYEISDMPIADIIEMVAGLLTKITTTNDQHYEHLHRHLSPSDMAADMSSQTSSVLAFHGKNVPSITILSYLTRIHKYCPATWEVFLSLLVYFDRMTERVNSGPMQSLRQANQEYLETSAKSSQVSMKDLSQGAGSRSVNSPLERSRPRSASNARFTPAEPDNAEDCNLSHFFVVDSFNIHRLVIAGVTCAAKYFSDIFFTNSRYAKVGGLPLVELNHLELQFLILNDFRLAVPVEELEAYATMLVEFYAREVVSQQQPEKGDGIEMVTR